MASDKGLDRWEKANRIPVDEFGSPDPVFKTLWSAYRNGNNIDIIYYGGEFPGVARTISPLQIFKVRGYPHIYVEAYCHTGKVVRNFRIDRLKLVTPTPKEDTYRTPTPSVPEKSLGSGCLIFVITAILLVLILLAIAFGATRM